MRFTVLALSPAIVLFVLYVALGTPSHRDDPYRALGALAVLVALVALGILQRYWRARISARGRLDARGSR